MQVLCVGELPEASCASGTSPLHDCEIPAIPRRGGSANQVRQGFASSVVGAAPGGTPRNVAIKTNSPSPTLDALCT
jgi:hypothetical protein